MGGFCDDGDDLYGYVTEERAAEIAQEAFRIGAARMQSMLANFVEHGGDPVTAQSLRLNWPPSWGPSPVSDPESFEADGWLEESIGNIKSSPANG